MEFVETPAFTRVLSNYLSDEAYRAFQLFLARNPEAGEVMPGTGGFRKVRWADTRTRRGKRGGLRIIYYYFSVDSQIWLFTAYSKGELADLSPEEKRALKAAITKETGRRRAHGGTVWKR